VGAQRTLVGFSRILLSPIVYRVGKPIERYQNSENELQTAPILRQVLSQALVSKTLSSLLALGSFIASVAAVGSLCKMSRILCVVGRSPGCNSQQDLVKAQMRSEGAPWGHSDALGSLGTSPLMIARQMAISVLIYEKGSLYVYICSKNELTIRRECQIRTIKIRQPKAQTSPDCSGR
jgi:hypothetical protein